MARLSPEQAARELLARFVGAHQVDAADVRAGLNLPMLLEFLALEHRDVPKIVYGGREFVGELDAAQHVMLLSEAFPKMRIFTIAHEIGHHELHPKRVSDRDPPAYVLGPQPGRPDERDANLFAIALLMPEQGVRAAYFARFDRLFIRHSLTEEQVYWLRLGHDRNICREKIETGSLRRLAWFVATCGSMTGSSQRLNALGLRPTRTAYRSPWQNGVAERWVGSVRSELLDRAVVFNERHRRRLLGEYVAYCHEDRTHYALEKETPGGRQPSASESTSTVVASRRLGGLHHRYNWAVEKLAG